MSTVEDRRAHAEESVAPRFTRVMRATTSPWGTYTDPPIVALATAVTATAALGVGMRVGDAAPLPLLVVVALLPVWVSLGVGLSLLSARAKVVEWLVSLPFPVENMNGLLHGVGDRIRVRFEKTRPDRDALNAALEAVHEDCFVLEFEDETDLEVECKIGVLESKHNPTRAAYRRYRRVQQMIERVLVPISDEHPIADVWIC
ncbi:MAG: hypothetical protein JRI23_19130 [Deltaproteobacteria bacterium]|jgi:hypothetical protein|nr:hypothetical protein [Deltaproteobacteria bacterium]MBW2533979.1 hypothetical protein [Deltaproteobacteria bacterium]